MTVIVYTMTSIVLYWLSYIYDNQWILRSLCTHGTVHGVYLSCMCYIWQSVENIEVIVYHGTVHGVYYHVCVIYDNQ